MGNKQSVFALVDEIKSTKEFLEFKQARANLNKYRDLKQEVEMLQKKQMMLLKSNKSPKEIQREAKEIDEQFQRLSKNPKVNKVITTGERFNKMISQIFQDISKMLNSELKL